MVDLAVTSVPAWAVAPEVQEVDLAGREIFILAVGTGEQVESVVSHWTAVLQASEHGIPVQFSSFPDARAAAAALPSTTAAATVGARFMVAGSASDCAVVRAAALQHGWTDEEIRVGSVDASERLVSCTHCGTTTSTDTAMEGVFRCPGCARNLFVYYHFSRRSGTYIGFMVDAEDAVPSPSGALSSGALS